MTKPHTDHIEAAWLSRAKVQGWEPGTDEYTDHETEFFVGAMTALQAVYGDTGDRLTSVIPTSWVVNIIAGLPVVEV